MSQSSALLLLTALGGAMGGRGTKTTTDSELCVCVNVLLLFILMLLGKVSQMSVQWNLQKY